ncbi:cystathionine beta-lyase [Sphingomicrobium marinum]|uniref:cystathionine beta-lyase n=1 Tax=Sphingomicrobium marinum TaxID=1227950 RepID=UPI0022407CAA|nr:cystathionine beta-lyase [Sphingomicrobium marinum]
MTKDRRGIETRLIHPLKRASAKFEAVSPPIHRASTVLFDTIDAVFDEQERDAHYRYATMGTPTTRELEARLCEIEGAVGVELAPSGLAALSLTYLAACKAGDHVLIPASAYSPNTRLGDFLKRFGIEVEAYDPLIGPDIELHFRPNTRLVWCESPGSISMEIQDVPAIIERAHRHGALVAVDNTYAAGLLFNPLDHGADFSVQALTKYQGGHGDVLMGAVATRDAARLAELRAAAEHLGSCVSSDDAALVLRGLRTLFLRLRHVERGALELATWLDQHEEVASVLHPALPACPGHDIWKRDFSGAAGIFSVIFKDWSRARVERFVDALELFKIGYSWGGPVSLVMAYRGLSRPSPEAGERLVRFSVGLEELDDLKADIVQAIAASSQP